MVCFTLTTHIAYELRRGRNSSQWFGCVYVLLLSKSNRVRFWVIFIIWSLLREMFDIRSNILLKLNKHLHLESSRCCSNREPRANVFIFPWKFNARTIDHGGGNKHSNTYLNLLTAFALILYAFRQHSDEWCFITALGSYFIRAKFLFKCVRLLCDFIVAHIFIT